MRWIPGGRSSNLDDQRGASPGGFRGGGFGGGGARLGIGGTLVLIVLSLVFKRDLVSEFGGGGGVPGAVVAPSASGSANGAINDPNEENMVQFVSFVLDTTQATWKRIVPNYTDARVTLFRNSVESACGLAEAASGPFYCPGDQKVYVDLAFFDQLKSQFGAPGDFAQAYVLAHEIGHHVQNLLGTEQKLRAAQQQNPGQAKQLSVAMELQADCFAGVWGNAAAKSGILEAGDVEEGLGAAAAVGDDRLQKMATGRVSPESFTHGSSADRMAWFKRGFDSGDPNRCDTFANRR